MKTPCLRMKEPETISSAGQRCAIHDGAGRKTARRHIRDLPAWVYLSQ